MRATPKIDTNPVLVVIDMQPEFEAANDLQTINAVAREITKAREAKQWIFFLEYQNDGPTHPCLVNLIKGYEKVEFIQKTRDDGSYWIHEDCRELDLAPEAFVVCGVNTAACVVSTVRGLSKIFFQNTPVRVVRDACNGYPGCRSFKNFDKLQNVVVD